MEGANGEGDTKRAKAEALAMRATILFLNSVPGYGLHEMKLAGVGRYAAVRGWEVVAVSRRESRRSALRSLFAAHKPVAGCIVNNIDDDPPLQPELFGDVPVVYFNPPSSLRSGRAATVVADNAALAGAAFRELSSRRPPAYAIVEHSPATEWSVVRSRAFASLASGARTRCDVFEAPSGSGRAAALARFLAALPRDTAVFAVNDETAAEVVAAARAARRSIPRDLALCSIDNDLAVCEAVHPYITSIQVVCERAGFLAAALLGEKERTSVSYGPMLAGWRESTGGAGRREPHILAAVERIRREACDGLTARQVIAAAPGSKRLFTLRFREATGHSVLEEIRHVRLEKAEMLLSRTDTAIGAIPDFCGWGSPVSLERFFRARTGMTMREWRRKYRR